MRLSDAIAMGRTLCEPKRATIYGCAMGMANHAIGGMIGYCTVEKAWPWIVNNLFVAPCKCSGTKNGAGVIIHLFDFHVMTLGDWTLDQLIDWVRSVEPVPETPAEVKESASEPVRA